MKISGEINIFVEDIKLSEAKTMRKLKTNISTKQEDGTYLKFYKDVTLSTKNFPEEKVAKLDPAKVYTMDIADGWLNVRSYVAKDGTTKKVDYIFVNKGRLISSKAIDQEKRKNALAAYEAKKGVSSNSNAQDEDLPF